MNISDPIIAAFKRDGAVLLPGLMADWVGPLSDAVMANMAAPGPSHRIYRPDGDAGAPFFQDYCNWQRLPGFRAAIEKSDMAAVAARLMSASSARFFHEHVLVKEPGNTSVTPWHQDQLYYPVDGMQSVSFWLPLDPVPRETAIEYVAGSHLGQAFRPDRFDGTTLYTDDSTAAVPDIDANRERFRLLGWAMQPGDAVAFTFRTIHGAPGNSTSQRRRVVSFRWVGDDATFARRPGRTSPPFPEVTLPHGAPLSGPEFPVVWQAEG